MKWTAIKSAQTLASVLTTALIITTVPVTAGDCSAEKSCQRMDQVVDSKLNSTQLIDAYQDLYPDTQMIDQMFAVRSKQSVREFGEKVLSVPHDFISVIKVSSPEKLDELIQSDQVEYIAPAFSKNGATLIMTDTVMVMFEEKMTKAEVTELLEPYNLYPVRDAHSVYWEVKTKSRHGFQLAESVSALNDLDNVVLAEVDTLQKTARMNYTGEYGQKDFGGTSGAVAMVAGTVGLMREANNDLHAYEINDILRQTADPGFPGLVDALPEAFISWDSNGEWSDLETTAAVYNAQTQTIEYEFERVIQYSPTYGDGVIDPIAGVSTAISKRADKGAGLNKGGNFINLADDPLSNLQWYAFDSIYSQLVTGFSYLRFDQIFQQLVAPDASNTNVRIVVIDDGIATDHPEINLIQQYDTLSNSTFTNAAQPRSGTGHGTAVAGLIAARDNQSGIVGILPGFPVIGVRVEAVDGDRGNEHFFTRLSDVADGLAYVLAEATSPNNFDNRYVVAVTTAGIPSYDGLAEDDDSNGINFFTSIARTLAANNVNLVFPAGNGNNDLSDRITYNFIGPQDQVSLEEDELPLIQAGLIVGAIHSNAGIVNQDPLGAKASYSNTGPQISLVAPSGDDTFNTFKPRESIQVNPRKLSMVSTDVNFLSLGGNDIREYDVPANFTSSEITIEIPAGGVVGISNWPTVFENLFSSDESATENEFLKRGVFFLTPAGTLEIYPNVTQDENGIISGTSLIQVRDSNNVVTSERLIPTTGRMTIQRSGVRRDRESFSSGFVLNGRDSAGNVFNITGREAFRVFAGEIYQGSAGDDTEAKNIPLTPAYDKLVSVPNPGGNRVIPPDQSGYRVSAAIRLQGGGVERTAGWIRRSIIDGTEAAGFPTAGDSNAIDYALASFYSPNIAPTQSSPSQNGGVTQIIGGSASLDSDFDFITGFGNTGVRARIIYSPPAQRGEYIAIGRTGNYSARAQGFHTAANDQVIIDLADATSYAANLVFRTPGSSNNIIEDDLPEFVFVD